MPRTAEEAGAKRVFNPAGPAFPLPPRVQAVHPSSPSTPAGAVRGGDSDSDVSVRMDFQVRVVVAKQCT